MNFGIVNLAAAAPGESSRPVSVNLPNDECDLRPARILNIDIICWFGFVHNCEIIRVNFTPAAKNIDFGIKIGQRRLLKIPRLPNY